MQSGQNSNKQQQPPKQQQHRRLQRTSGPNAFSQSRHSAGLNSKLAANKVVGGATGAAVGQGDAADAIRSVQFRTQICNNISHTKNNTNGFPRATSKAQDAFSANSGCRRGSAAESMQSQPSAAQPCQLPSERLSYYELNCRINYGDFRQVQVQFHSPNQRCCTFSWKRKFRLSGIATRRPRPQQPSRWQRKRHRRRKMQQRCGVWLSTCQQRARNNSMLSSNETLSNGDGAEAVVAEENYANDCGDVSEDTAGCGEDDSANKTLVAGDDQINDNANDSISVATDAPLLVDFSERAAEVTAKKCRNTADYSHASTNYANQNHKAAAVAVVGVDLIDFSSDAEQPTIKICGADAAFEESENAITSADIVQIGDGQCEVPVISGDTYAAAGDSNQIGGDGRSTLLIAAEVSGDLLVGDCKGVDPPQKKVNQIVCTLNENQSCARVQLTAECGSDQNRVIGTAASKNVKHADAPTELHEINHNNNNSITTTISNGTTTTRTNSQTTSPILGHHGKKTATTPASAATGVTVSATLLEKKTQSKFLPTRGKALLQKSHQQQRSAEDTPVSGGGAAERLDASELQRLKYLNRHSCNGRLDYEAIERHLEQTELQEEQRNKSIEVLGVLLQYAVHDLDAFACPRVKAEKEKIQNYLSTTLKLLDEAKSNCSRLQDQLCDKEGYYTQREEDLQTLHRCEMEKAQTSLSDYQAFAQEKFAALESQLEAQAVEHKRTLDSYRLEVDNKLSQKQQQLDEAEQRELKLKERFNLLAISEQELREKLTSTENAYAARFQAATEREHNLNERVKALTKELNGLRASNENRERELRDKLNLSQDEISVLRSSQRSFNESLDRSSGISSPRNSSMSELARLQSEADSLHCVLELKQKEISKLTKHNEELMRDAEERGVLQGKISLLESNNEMLKSELDIKSEKEKDFLRKINDMQKAYNHEMVKRKRLSYDNEQLQWQLKQRSEQLHIVETKLHELSAVDSINTSNQSSIGLLNRSQLMNGSSLINIPMEDISPPTSPVVKGVIEKPDSVSWVLEMDDETPEAAASKMVKRAGSFRSVERSPSTRRQLSACSSAINTSLNSVGSGPTYGNDNISVGPNPLSQSMSATSVIRQHSSDGRHEFSNRSHSRIRSKSVSVKSTEPAQAGTGALNTGSVGTKSGKRLMRQSSSSTARKQHQLELINWKEPISSSSPHANAIRPRTSTMCSEVSEETVPHETSLFQRTSISSAPTRKLITCDTSKLNSGERLDMQSLPTHASVHDLKKKFHEIQESAGEAMVSGTNSEDEGCSASSDEIVCSVSTSSATTGSTSSLKNSHMSLEEVLLLDKIHSLNGTPMEVSWSDDPEVFTNGSTV